MNSRSATKLIKLPVMGLQDRVIYFLLLTAGLGVTGWFGVWWFKLSHIPQNFSGIFHLVDITLFIVLSYVVWYQIINELFYWITAHFMKHPQYMKPQKGSKVAFLTAFVPGKEPYDVLEKSLQAMANTDYPHDTWLLDEGNDAEAQRICAKYGVKHFSRKGIAKYNEAEGNFKAKTKAGNYNAWYDCHADDYDFVAQIDVDFLPRKDFLTKTLGYFRDPEVAFVGSPQVYGNTEESWIAKGAAEQGYSFHGPMQKGLFGHDMTLFIGANHVVRVAAHDAIGGYSGHIVEDHLTGMKFYAQNWKSVYVPETLALGEGPSTWDAYFSQQMRWAYGLFDILFTQSPKLFPKMQLRHMLNYFQLQQYYFFGLSQVLGVTLLTLYFVFGIQSTAMELDQMLLLYPMVILIQQIMFLWLQKFNIDPEKESGLMLRAKLLSLAVWPVYVCALFGALTRKKLNYAVTPKGSKQKDCGKVRFFIPHVVLGTVTMIDIFASFYTHHQAGQLIFWAWLNTFIMYQFFFSEVLKNVVSSLKTFRVNFSFTS